MNHSARNHFEHLFWERNGGVIYAVSSGFQRVLGGPLAIHD